MAIAFRAAKLGSGIATDESSMGLQENDIVLANYYDEVGGAGSTVVTPATGFTELTWYNDNPGGFAVISHGTYWARRGAGAIATNWSVSGGGSGQVISLVAYSGCKLSGSPVNAISSVALGSDNTIECPSVTTTQNGSVAVGLIGQAVFNAASSTDWANERYDGATSVGTICYDDNPQPVAGPTGVQVATQATGSSWAATTIALEDESPPASPPVYFQALGAKSAGGTTTVSVPYPASPAAGDMVLVGRVGWNDTITFTDESGWTNTAGLPGGTGTGAAAHTTEVRVDRREAAGGESGSVTFDQGGTISGALGIMALYRKMAGSTWDVATATGNDSTHGANRSITASSSVALAPGDVVVAVAAADIATSLTITAPAITAAGITFGTTTRRTSGAGVTTGNDGNVEIFDATVVSGTATAAPALAYTVALSQCGPAAFVRLRAVSAGVSGAASASFGGTFAAAGTPRTPGVATASLGGVFAAVGQPRTFGAAAVSLGFTATALGTKIQRGVAVASFGGSFVAAGIDRALGQATASLGFTATADGEIATAAVQGQAVAALGFTAAGSGIRRRPGTATASLGFTGTALGVPRTRGSAAATLGFTGTAAGKPRKLGTALASLGPQTVASGVRRGLGEPTATFGGTFTAVGFAGTPPKTGQATVLLGGTFSAAGIDRALGQATVTLGFAAVSVGRPRHPGAATAALGFAATVAGRRRVVGLAGATFGFTAEVFIINYNITLVSVGTNRYSASGAQRYSSPSSNSRYTRVAGVNRYKAGG